MTTTAATTVAGVLEEYTNTPDAPDLTEEEQSRMDELWQNDFYLEEKEPQFREI